MSQTAAKTERPTEKRLRDARRKGQVAKSQDLSSSLLLISSLGVLWIAGHAMCNQLSAAISTGIRQAASFTGKIEKAHALAILFDGTGTIALVLIPLFAVSVVVAFVGYMQVGPLFAADVLRLNPNKLNPVEGFRRFLKPHPYIEIIKTILKIMIATIIFATVFWRARQDIVEVIKAPVERVASYGAALMFDAGFKTAIAFFAFGVGDYFLQRFLHFRDLRMTKQEVKEEYKETEGDSFYKGMRRELHREILMQNIVESVRQADVVIVNPTHLAIALRYDRATTDAPVVVAKGAELMAGQIRRMAREARVPVTRDVSLARALFELELGAEIPEDLYEAVAVVLRWIYGLARNDNVNSREMARDV